MRTHRVEIVRLYAALLILLMTACGKETANIPDTTPPQVSSTAPAQGATAVAVNTALSATFTKPMNASTINATSFVVAGPGGAAVSGTVTYAPAGSVATFTPAANLAYGSTYTATITTAATDQASPANRLAANYVWTFTTVAPPTVVSTVPASGATSVPLNQAIAATFSMPMNPATIDAATFTVTGPGGVALAGTVTYAATGSVATFTPAANLAYSTLYTATITTGATNQAGIPLAANYQWSFTTITPPPVVVSTFPPDGATGVLPSQVLRATFNEAMNCATLVSPATTFSVTGPGGVAVAGAAGCNGNVATFTPAAALAINATYTATITTAAKSVAGTPLAANYVWKFKTGAPATGPTVTSTVPSNGATGVPTNQSLSAVFNEAMDPATITGTTFTLSSAGGVVRGTVTYTPAGSVATFVPAAFLTPTTLYTATITTGAQDGQARPLAANYVWTFTTAAGPDTTRPTVISTLPANLATNVPTNQAITATFSKAMNPASLTSSSFTLQGPGGVAVTGAVTYAAAGDTASFTPSANLAPSSLFSATITKTATDLEGNALAANYVWTFTTAAAPDTTPPVIVTTVPANTATNVPINQAVSAAFSEAMDPLTITTATFGLTGPGGAVVTGTVAYDAVNFIATFTPTASLAGNSAYIATVTAGATDLSGNPLGSTGAPNPWTFTTGVVVVPSPIPLGTASLFGGFGGSAGLTNEGTETVINGNIGTTGVSTLVTGFHDNGVGCIYTETPLNVGLVNGSIDTSAPPPTVSCPTEGTAVTAQIAAAALGDALTAYNQLVAIPNGLDVSTCPGCGGGAAGELGNRTLAPGIYKSAPGSYGITLGPLTLDAQGDPNAYWVFQMASTLTVGTPSSNQSVLLVNGAQAKNVFWQVGTAATINGILGGGTMQGTIISQAGVSISTAGVVAVTTLNGRALCLSGPVTITNTVINVPAP